MKRRSLLLVVGPGRSGTSSFAGTMHHQGFYVPPPVVAPAESNPRGHFEPLWVIKFNNKIMQRSGFGVVDGDPLALTRTVELAGDEAYRQELRGWLGDLPVSEEHVVIKDTRAVWFTPLWEDVASELDFDISYVTMLRAPAEVVGSHAMHYQNAKDVEQAQREDTARLAGWINLHLVTEEMTVSRPRRGVVYPDLLSDWRQAMKPLAQTFGWDLDFSHDGTRARGVDDFLDVGLHRVRATWEGSGVPDSLRRLADDVWETLTARSTDEMDEETYRRRMAEFRTQYSDLYLASELIANDRIKRISSRSRRVGYNQGVAAARKALQDLG